MDIISYIKNIAPESLHACVAICAKLDRIYPFAEKSGRPSKSILRTNAGFSADLDLNSRDGYIARGVFEWLVEFHDNTAAFSLSNTSVKSMHRKIFKYSPRDGETRGRYRNLLDDTARILFESTKEALNNEDRHPLFVISLFRSAFLELMPFVTGNSLCANILSYALLFTHTYPLVGKTPLLSLLNCERTDDPLLFLPKTLTPLLMLQLDAGNSATEKEKGAGTIYLNSRRKSLLRCIENNAPLKISDIMLFLPDENRNTIKKDLLFLRDNNFILAQGEKRGMYYRVPGPKADIDSLL